MQKIRLTLLLLLTLKLSYAQVNIDFPDSFRIPAEIMPSNFIYEPLNEEARQAGVVKNPGIVRGGGFLQEIYEDADINTIEALHVAMYVPKDDPDFELGIYTIAYRSPGDLENEIRKMRMYVGSRYLYTGRYMVRVWGDSGSFEAEVNTLADYLKHKLNLLEFIPTVPEDNETGIAELTGE